MNKKWSLFSTDLYEVHCDIDVDELFEKCKAHQKNVTNVIISNRGGYQGVGFSDQEFTNTVLSFLPVPKSQLLPQIVLQAWVNINGFGHWNALHNHLDEMCLISGIFYVRCPENSGDLYFYDPRYFSNAGTHYQFYRDEDVNNGGYIQLTPKPNRLLFFPPSLFHMVGPNLSHEQRCSIAFNVLVVPGQKF